MKVQVCANCGLIKIAEEGCPVCLGTVFKEVELPERLRCAVCGKVRSTSSILKTWEKPPYYNDKDGTYYDGCRGWE